ncbi:RNA-binding protein 39-like protein isoform X2 [Tanacetum coccineum]|uniref:RNA-binding protein 39-like protein isoform X2 n=1 Tax=Tanacetum coccineum TaxID=301880 RepID=A0ABQ5IQC8_9ASTR
MFEAFGPVELVKLPTDPETGNCKGFGFTQFAQLEHLKGAQSLNGNLEIAGRIIKVSLVTDHVRAQDTREKVDKEVLTEYILVSVTSVVIVTIAGVVKEATTILEVFIGGCTQPGTTKADDGEQHNLSILYFEATIV